MEVMIPVDRDKRICDKLRRWAELVSYFDQLMTDARKKNVEVCPRCFSSNVAKGESGKSGKRRGFRCKSCGYHFYEGKLSLNLKTPREIINTLLHVRLSGCGPVLTSKIAEFILKAFKREISLSKDITYHVEEEVAKNLEWFIEFLLIDIREGLPGEILQADEIFIHPRKDRERLEELHGQDKKIKRKKRKNYDFFYLITSIIRMQNMTVLLPPTPAYSRDSTAFSLHMGKIRRYLHDPLELKEIRHDDLSPLKGASELIFPEIPKKVIKRKKVGAVIRKESLGATAHVERANENLRRTLRKAKKVGSLKILKNLTTIQYAFWFFLEKHSNLGRKTVVEKLGFAWPKSIECFADLIFFVLFVKKFYKKYFRDVEEVKKLSVGDRGLVIVSLHIPPFPANESSIKHVPKTPMFFGINNAAPMRTRDIFFKELYEAIGKDYLVIPEDFSFPARYDYTEVKVIPEPTQQQRVHLVFICESGRWLMMMRRGSGFYVFPDFVVDAGKINQLFYSHKPDDENVKRDSRMIICSVYKEEHRLKVKPSIPESLNVFSRISEKEYVNSEIKLDGQNAGEINLKDLFNPMILAHSLAHHYKEKKGRFSWKVFEWAIATINNSRKEIRTLQKIVEFFNADNFLVSCVAPIAKKIAYEAKRNFLKLKGLAPAKCTTARKVAFECCLYTLYLLLNETYGVSFKKYVEVLREEFQLQVELFDFFKELEKILSPQVFLNAIREKERVLKSGYSDCSRLLLDLVKAEKRVFEISFKHIIKERAKEIFKHR